MRKAFIVSDVHGFYSLMMKSLTDAGFDINNENHVFVSLGDLLDRGEEPLQCLYFVNSLPENRKILIKGNHEDLLNEMLARKYPRKHDYSNQTIDTVLNCMGVTEMSLMQFSQFEELFDRFQRFKEWSDYYNSCINYWEDDKNIFVHGWLPCKYRCLDTCGQPYQAKFDTNWRDREWEGARWYNGMYLWSQNIKVPDKTIWCGHWHSSWGHCNLHNDGVEFLKKIETYHIDPVTGNQEPHVNNEPFEDEGICAMDACTVLNHKVNCKVIDIDY